MAGFAGETELDQCSGFEGALKWMEEGGVNICLGFCTLDVFQLDGNRRVWGMEGETEMCMVDLWNQATHTNGGNYFNVVIIGKWVI